MSIKKVKLTDKDGTTIYPRTSIQLVSGLQDSLDNKQDKLVSGSTLKTVGGSTLLASGNVDLTTFNISASSTELNNTQGVTSNIQTQLNTKLSATELSPFTITNTLTNTTYLSSITELYEGQSATLYYKADDGYDLPSEITVEGATKTWTQSTGTLVLSNVSGNISITITSTPQVVTYTITQTLTGCVSNIPSSIEEGESITGTVTALSGYALPDTITVTGCTYTWTKSTGTLVLSNATGNVSITISATEIIPLCFTANTAGSTITFTKYTGSNVQTSTDCITWTDYTDWTTITLTNAGDKVYFKGTDVTTHNSFHFSMTGSIAASGDVTSLTNGVGGDVALTEASCYRSMFRGCSSLTAAPALPAKTLASSCYEQMFYNCQKLTTAPELPATTLAEYCYQNMFTGCKSLTTAPSLPATTLADSCYSYMFCNCTNLTTAPTLPVTTLANNCYYGMFDGCTSLTVAPALPATTLANNCYREMFDICTSLTEAPELPATTLTDSCYESMFQGCTNLTTAPNLPATTLADNCYCQMFYYCTSIKLSTSQTSEYTKEYRIPTSGTGTVGTDSLTDMFTGTGGTFTGTPAINTTYYMSNTIV